MPNQEPPSAQSDPFHAQPATSYGPEIPQQHATMPAHVTSVPQKRRSHILLIGLLAVLTLGIIILLITQNTDNQPKGAISPVSETSNVSVSDHAFLAIKAYGGNISVHTGSTNQITIDPRYQPDHPKGVRILFQQTRDAQGHDHLTATTDPWFKNIDLNVTIPPTTSLSINVGSGDVDVHGGTGATIETASGSIALDSIQGPVNAQTDSGDITADTLSGPTTIAGQSGSLRLSNIKGQLTATTTSGDIIVHNSVLSKQSLLKTQNGSVRFTGSLDANGSYTMTTTNADVDLTLPGTTAFTLNASTNSGTVQNEFGATTVGTAPRAQIQLSTQNGSINVMKTP